MATLLWLLSWMMSAVAFEGKAKGPLRRAVARSSSANNEDRVFTVTKLNDLFYKGGDEVATSIGVESGELPRLPLFRVQWNALPGAREVYHVHVPHYTAMFEGLVRSPRPWLFGHLWLPGGSENLRNEEYALRDGTQAALTGTLMELLTANRLDDGRLSVVAQGVGRFRVRSTVKDVPYFVVDAELCLDDDELVTTRQDAARCAAMWRKWEYSSDDIAPRVLRGDFESLPEIAPVGNPAAAPQSESPESPEGASATAALSALELRCWTAIAANCDLLLKCLQADGVVDEHANIALPAELLALQPPGLAALLAPAVIAPAAKAFTPAPQRWPLARRCQRLSFAVPTAIGDSLLSRDKGRQRLLESHSTADRLRIVVELLELRVDKIAAILAAKPDDKRP